MVFRVGGRDYAYVFGVEVGEEGGTFCCAEFGRDVDLPIREALEDGEGGRGDAAHGICFRVAWLGRRLLVRRLLICDRPALSGSLLNISQPCLVADLAAYLPFKR